MRQIKFRQWCSRDKKFKYWGYLNNNWESFYNPFGYMSKDNERPSQQFTGLTDKNGKEIYEGDILKVNGVIGVVEYRQGYFYVQYDEHTEYLWETKSNYKIVIGNVFENSNLIN